ncbi:MAG: zinc ribbon domain-containing protein [Thermoproteus sp.]
MSSRVEEFRCSYCGAPLDVGPDSVVVVCRYCGRPNFVAGNADEVLAVPAIRGDEAAKRALEAARRSLQLRFRLKRAVFGDPDLYYVPYYFVDLSLKARYRAKVLVTYTRTVYVGREARTEVVTREVSVAGDLNYGRVVPVLARRAVEGIASERLAERYLSARPQARRLEEIELGYRTSKAFLAAEFGKKRAEAVALRDAVEGLLEEVDRDAAERARRRVGHMAAATKILDKTVDFDVEKADVSPLTYLPAWVVPYIYDGSQYAIAVAGWDGSLLAMTRPVFLEERAGVLTAAALAAGFLGGLGGGVLPHSYAVGLALIGAGVLAGFYIARGATKAIEVKK